MGLTSDQLAERLEITGGALRQIETNTKPVSLALAFRAERVFQEFVDPELTVDDLIVDEDQKPAPDPGTNKPAPKVERTAPPTRKTGGDRKGPPRSARTEQPVVGAA